MVCDVSSWFVMFRGGLSGFVMVRDVSWWFVVVHSGSWWFNHGGFMVVRSGFPWWFCGGSWWFVVVFLQKSPEKGHVTLYLTNHRTKFTMKSHF